MPHARRNGRGLAPPPSRRRPARASPAIRDAQDAPSPARSAARTRPAPQARRNPRHRARNPRPGWRSGVKVLRPAQRLWIRSTLAMVRCSIRCAASATSISSAWASTGRSAPRPSAKRTGGRSPARSKVRRRPSWRTGVVEFGPGRRVKCDDRSALRLKTKRPDSGELGNPVRPRPRRVDQHRRRIALAFLWS